MSEHPPVPEELEHSIEIIDDGGFYSISYETRLSRRFGFKVYPNSIVLMNKDMSNGYTLYTAFRDKDLEALKLAILMAFQKHEEMNNDR